MSLPEKPAAAAHVSDNAENGLDVKPPFVYSTWLAEGHANADKLPAGVVLPESKDWADKLAKEWKETPLCEALGLADFIRANCQPREVSNG
jgi:hypothetical protein